jgi:hypothetical protein
MEFIEKEKRIAGTIASQISFTKVYEDLGVKVPVWQNVPALVGRIVPGLPMRGIRIDCSDPDLEVQIHSLRKCSTISSTMPSAMGGNG